MNNFEQIFANLSSSNSPLFPWIIYIGILGILILFFYILFALIDKESRARLGIIISLLVILGLIFLGEGKPLLSARKFQPVKKVQPRPKPEPLAKAEEPKPPPPPPPEPKEEPKPVPVTVPEKPKPAPKPGLAIITEKPKPEPKPAPAPPPPPKPEPKPQPKPAPKPKEKPPATSPGKGIRMTVSNYGTGTINIEVRGPILEVSKTHQPYAHLMIVLDGKYALVVPPTRYREQKKENEFGEEELTSVTYFWEKIKAGFDKVPQGPHSLMIDVSLESPQVHKSKMIGSGNLENDWNGFIQVSEHQTSTLVFGTKNWLTQELERIR